MARLLDGIQRHRRGQLHRGPGVDHGDGGLRRRRHQGGAADGRHLSRARRRLSAERVQLSVDRRQSHQAERRDRSAHEGRPGAPAPARARRRRLRHQRARSRVASAAAASATRTSRRSTRDWSTRRSPRTARPARRRASPASTASRSGRARDSWTWCARPPDVPPARSLPGMGDHPTGMSLFAAIMAGLYHRERTGRGTVVSTSLMANGLWMNAIPVQGILCGTRTEVRPPREESVSALANLYRCRDGRWFMLTITGDERHWPSLRHGHRPRGPHERSALRGDRGPAHERARPHRDPRRGASRRRTGRSGIRSSRRRASRSASSARSTTSRTTSRCARAARSCRSTTRARAPR